MACLARCRGCGVWRTIRETTGTGQEFEHETPSLDCEISVDAANPSAVSISSLVWWREACDDCEIRGRQGTQIAKYHQQQSRPGNDKPMIKS